MSSEDTHYSTLRIQDSTRCIVKDSIVLVMEPQISLNLKSVPVGLAMNFGKDWIPNWSTSTKPGTQQLSSASVDFTGSSNGAHLARLFLVVSEEAAGWVQTIAIRSDIERERF